jgi:hypothetical protein
VHHLFIKFFFFVVVIGEAQKKRKIKENKRKKKRIILNYKDLSLVVKLVEKIRYRSKIRKESTQEDIENVR